MKSKRSDKYTVLVLLFFTLIYLGGAINLGSPYQNGEPTLSFFPWITIFAMIISIICYYLGSKKEYSDDKENENAACLSLGKLLSGCLILGLFILFFYFLGYWIASIFLCFSMALMFENGSSNFRKSVVIAALVSILIPTIGYLFYQKLFHIRLPEGILW